MVKLTESHHHVDRLGCASTGSSSLTLDGTGFGSFAASARARFGRTKAEATSWLSTTTVTIRLAHAISASRIAVVTAGTTDATYTGGISFNVGQINVFIVPELRNHATTGSILLTVAGLGFNHHYSSAECRVLGSSSENTAWTSGSSPCLVCVPVICNYLRLTRSCVYAETSMTIKTPHAIESSGSLVVTAIQLSASSTQVFSYHIPSVSHMHVNQFSKAKGMAGTGSYEFSGNP